MKYRSCSLADAFDTVWKLRCGTWIAPHLMKLLVTFEAALFRNVVRSLQRSQENNGHPEPVYQSTLSLTKYVQLCRSYKDIVDPIFEREKQLRNAFLAEAEQRACPRRDGVDA
ncbi:unnamed protein product [Amoebophrya sp. A25]|nr:unnamed protein product [Amoebophrya sp. A25]|eukprot:GSA25T00007738001.1